MFSRSQVESPRHAAVSEGAGQTVTGPSVVSHAHRETQEVLRRYLRAFLGNGSGLVVAPPLVDALRAEPRFADWHVTDCTSRFEPGSATGSGLATGSGDELILATSGTTGNPKMVRHAKPAVRACAAAIAASLALNPERDYVALVNPRFAYGLSILHSHAVAGVPVRFQPAPTSLTAWAELRATLLPDSSVYLAPHHSFLLAQDPIWQLDGLLELILAGGPVRPSMVTALQSTFPSAVLVVMYGQAELGPRITLRRTPIGEFEAGNVGRPLPGVTVRTAGTRGPIEVDSPFRMTSYVDLTGSPISDEPVDPRWWPTGDVGFVSAAGDLHVVDRGAADVNFLGTRVRLDQLREAVRTVPGVLDVRASAVLHDTYGQRPSLRVLVPHLDEGVDALERVVRKSLAASIGTAAAAVLVEFVDLTSLPESGKL